MRARTAPRAGSCTGAPAPESSLRQIQSTPGRGFERASNNSHVSLSIEPDHRRAKSFDWLVARGTVASGDAVGPHRQGIDGGGSNQALRARSRAVLDRGDPRPSVRSRMRSGHSVHSAVGRMQLASFGSGATNAATMSGYGRGFA